MIMSLKSVIETDFMSFYIIKLYKLCHSFMS